MRALTLHRPWPWAFVGPVECPKRVENRSWPPWPSIIGQDVALHAGQAFDVAAVAWMRRHDIHVPTRPTDHPCGAVAVARVVGYIDDRDDLGDLIGPPGSGLTLYEASVSRWFFGPFGWVFDDVRALPEPVPCREGIPE